MNQSDLATLRDRLTELSEAVGAKVPGEAGVKAWLMALRDFPLPEVVDALDQWVRTKAKMAAPSEIRALIAERLSNRRRAQESESANDQTTAVSDPNSPAYLRFKAWWKAFKPTYKHPDRIGTFIRVGALISSRGIRSGDFEAREERAAIQAESDPL